MSPQPALQRAIRSRRAVTVLLVALLVITVWSCFRLKASYERASVAAVNLADCREIAASIADLRQSPSHASVDVRPVEELSRRIEQAVTFANVPLGKVLRIEPQPARRIPDSSYIRHSTRVELELVSLQQLIMFLVSLEESDSRLQVTEIGLRAPTGPSSPATEPEVWNSDVFLSYLVFSPRDTNRGRPRT